MRAVLALLVLLPGPAVAREDSQLAAILSQRDTDQHPDLKGVIVLRNGAIVAERYYNGETPATLHDVRSAGKSITALLVGIAIDRRKIAGVASLVADSWPQARGSVVGSIPLSDILTMRSGLAANDDDPASPGNEDNLDAAADPLALLLALPGIAPPGTVYNYNSATAAVAGIVVAKATGETMKEFARQTLFAPLAIRRWSWAKDNAGFTKGQGNLSLTLRDFARLGEMVRQRGTRNGRSVVSAAWLDAMLAPHVVIAADDPYADHYGYFWYSKTHDIGGTPVPVAFASGNGGNKLYVIPSRQMVVAITSSAYGHGYGQRRSQDILKAILAADLKRLPPAQIVAGESH